MPGLWPGLGWSPSCLGLTRGLDCMTRYANALEIRCVMVVPRHNVVDLSGDTHTDEPIPKFAVGVTPQDPSPYGAPVGGQVTTGPVAHAKGQVRASVEIMLLL